MKNASLMSSDISQNRITVTCNYPRLHPGNNNWRLNYHIIIIKKQKKKILTILYLMRYSVTLHLCIELQPLLYVYFIFQNYFELLSDL